MKRPRLIPEWRQVLLQAWSIRLTLLAAALGGVELALPLFSDAMPRHLFAVLAILVSLATAAARVIAQAKLRKAEDVDDDAGKR